MIARRHGALPFVALFLASLSVRALAIFVLDAPARGVQTAHDEHHCIAASLARGEGFRFNFFGPLGQPALTSQQAPWTPGLLACCYWKFGVATRAAFLAMLSLQAVASAATVALLADSARLAVGSRRVGVLVGALAGFYPPLIVSAVHVQALVWNLHWLATFLWGVASFRKASIRGGACAMAIAGACGLLTDPILAAPMVAIGAGLVLRAAMAGGDEGRRQATALAGVAVAVVVSVTPWIWRNYQVHGRFVFIKDSFFYVLWQGNNAISLGTDKLLAVDVGASVAHGVWDARAINDEASEARLKAVSVNAMLTPEFIAELQALPNEIERMDRFRPLAWEATVGHPNRYAHRCLQRLTHWVWFDPTNPRSYLWHYRVSYLSLLALATPGLLLACRDLRAWWPIFLAGAALTLVHALVITSARFRIPMEMLAGSFAALTIDWAFAKGWLAWRSPRREFEIAWSTGYLDASNRI